jgi:hypothetical protein
MKELDLIVGDCISFYGQSMTVKSIKNNGTAFCFKYKVEGIEERSYYSLEELNHFYNFETDIPILKVINRVESSNKLKYLKLLKQ